MTKEELELEAEEYTEENGFGSDCNNLTSYDANCEIEQAYLVSAEPREKQIAELKQENKDLTDCNSRLLSLAAAATKRVIQQEKENAELKESNTYKACVKLAHQANVARDNLDEAKEIIKGLLSCCRNYPQENAEKIKQAEQFIKENE